MKCPKCNALMDTMNIDQIDVDICSGCGGLFLDDGEFETFTGIDPHTGFVRINKYAKVLSKLYNKAFVDELTNAYNRSYYKDFIEKLFKEKKANNLALCFIDIDHLKAANDKFGHNTGDMALKIVSSRIKSSIRESRDDYFFRIGGDEFILVFFDVGPDEAFKICDRIRKKIESVSINPDNENELSLTVSMGVAFSRITDNPESLYKRADCMLYRAKENGRNQVVVESVHDKCNEDGRNME